MSAPAVLYRVVVTEPLLGERCALETPSWVMAVNCLSDETTKAIRFGKRARLFVLVCHASQSRERDGGGDEPDTVQVARRVLVDGGKD